MRHAGGRDWVSNVLISAAAGSTNVVRVCEEHDERGWESQQTGARPSSVRSTSVTALRPRAEPEGRLVQRV
jgi:hypothetical protein